MFDALADAIKKEIEELKVGNRYKIERILETPQGAEITADGKRVLNFCANNYLGLAGDPKVISIAKKAIDRWGYGLSSVRFICGTQKIHKDLEAKITEFLGTEDTILYSSCFDANAGFFEVMTTKDDVIISDELNHASIIDGVRLSKAERKIFKHMEMSDLEEKLKESQNFRRRMIATDGVFSMDGDIADVKTICTLAEKYQAIVLVDDSHATGIVGPSGKGSHDYNGVVGRVDIITSTLGKALGGASGGFSSGKKEIIELLRQRSRPYLFSNTLCPAIAETSCQIIDLISKNKENRQRLNENTEYFRKKITEIGFDIKKGVHPIVPIMLCRSDLVQNMTKDLWIEGIFVIGMTYPVVPQGKERIRVQISAAHKKEHLDKAIKAFEKTGKKYGILK